MANNNHNPFSVFFNPSMFGEEGPGQAGPSGWGPSTATGGSRGTEPPEINVDFSGVKDKFENMGRKSLILLAILAVLVIAGAYWWFHPPISIHSTDTWFIVAVFILLPLFLFLRTKSHGYAKGTKKVKQSDGKAKTFKMLSLVPVLIFGVAIVGGVLSLAVFPGNASKYAQILVPEDKVFTEDIEEVNYSEIPVIDRNSAVILGNRTMGTMSDLVSQFEISTIYSQINYQDKPVRVSPLIYADLFKWLQNRSEGIPAYVIVDMTTQDAQVVRLDNPIKYSESEPLARNIDRYVQLKYPFYMFGEKSFEIDDEGNAWWICPVREFTIGLFGGETIGRVVMVNASTGETQDMAVDEVPNWVDHVYPANLIVEQYNWHGRYSSGWLNSILGQKGVVQTTPGDNGQLGYNYIAKDDDVWLYTGVTSATADNAIVGFVLVNQRTGESTFYQVPGATEESAMGSAEGQVQNLRYEATFPILINVDNVPTYFMALKDSNGLVKKYAMVDIERYQNVAVGDTVADTQAAYEQLLATNGTISTEDVTSDYVAGRGTVSVIAQAVVDGNSHYYVVLEGDDAIYDFALPAFVEIIKASVGDAVDFSYIPGEPVNRVTQLNSLTFASTGQTASIDATAVVVPQDTEVQGQAEQADAGADAGAEAGGDAGADAAGSAA